MRGMGEGTRAENAARNTEKVILEEKLKKEREKEEKQNKTKNPKH